MTEPLRKITKKEWDKIPHDFKGKWTQGVADFRGDIPKDWIGRKTLMVYSATTGGTELLTEGFHFEIVP